MCYFGLTKCPRGNLLNHYTMEFKIDTRSNHNLIRPLSGSLDAIVAEGLLEKCTSLSAEEGQNFLIDLSACQNMTEDAADALAALHEMCYGQQSSLVFIKVSAAVASVMDETGLDGLINIAPTEAEGVDIISMEILERDLMNE